MKKILLILAVVVCVAVAGSALAVAYNSASNSTGTLTADSYLSLSLNSCSTAALHLKAGDYVTYTIDYDVAKSDSAPSANLTIALAATAEHNLTGVEVALFTDSNCTVPLKLTNAGAIDAENGTAATISGANSLTITGLVADGLIYARFFLPDNATVATIGGTMTLSLDEPQA